MKKSVRSKAVLAVVLCLAGTVGFAESSGEATYKAKCLTCHGATGLANSGVGKMMKVKPATDPAVMKLTEAEMIAAVTNGAGKMQAYKSSLTGAQIKDAVGYFRTFMK